MDACCYGIKGKCFCLEMLAGIVQVWGAASPPGLEGSVVFSLLSRNARSKLICL